MAERFYIEHPETGERYKVDQTGFKRLYEARGFVNVGETRAEANKHSASMGRPQRESAWHDGMTVTDLRGRAKTLGISGYSGMNRDTLVTEIEQAEAVSASEGND